MVFQLIVGGIATGAIYALMAMGFSLLWQTSQTINFGQGEFVTAAAFIMLIFYDSLNLPYVLSLVLTIVAAVGILGILFRKVVVERLLKKGLLSLICATIAVSIMIRNSLIFYTAESRPFPSLVSKEAISILSIRLSPLDILNIALATLVIVALQLFIRKTKPGKALQAVAQNRDVAEVLGIDVARMTTLAFAINAIIVTFAAILVAPVYAAKYNMGIAFRIAGVLCGDNWWVQSNPWRFARGDTHWFNRGVHNSLCYFGVQRGCDSADGHRHHPVQTRRNLGNQRSLVEGTVSLWQLIHR